MGYQGKDKKNISANSHVSKWEYLNARAQRIPGWSVSVVAGLIIDDWFKRGCPPLHKVEKSLPPLPWNDPEKGAKS